MIHLDGHLLTMEDFDAVANGGSGCALGEEARAAMQASRDVVDRLVASGAPVYGITVGYGPLSGHVVDRPDLEAHQLNLLHHLTTGQGSLYSSSSADSRSDQCDVGSTRSAILAVSVRK